MKRVVLTVVLCIVGTVTQEGAGEGGTYHWTPEGETGSWSDQYSWTPVRDDPLQADIIYVDKEGGSTCTVDLGTLADSVAAVHVQRDNSVGHVSGTLTVGLAVNLGNGDGIGTYTISGGSLVASTLRIGTDTEGFFYQSGEGSEVIVDYLYVGGYTSHIVYWETSLYEMSGGELQVTGDVHIGWCTGGLFVQTAGEVTAFGCVYVGDASGGGVYDMQGGSLVIGGEEVGAGVLEVGRMGGGRFTQTGNSVVSVQEGEEEGSGIVRVGNGASGTYTLAGAESGLSAEVEIKVCSTGRFEWFGGSFSPRNIQTPLMTLQAGCTLAMGFDFDVEDLLAFEAGPLAGLSGAELEISNGATATQGEDALSVPCLRIGDWTFRGEAAEDYSGTYLLEDGTLAVGSDCEVGGFYGTPGTLTVSGGQMTVSGNLKIGTHSYAWTEGEEGHSVIGQGTVTLSGGTLAVQQDCIVGGNEHSGAPGADGTLVILGGELTVEGSLALIPGVIQETQGLYHGSGVLVVGSEEEAVDATITVGTDVVFGPRSEFTTIAPGGQASSLTLLLVGQPSWGHIEAVQEGDSNPLPGLGRTTVVFPIEDVDPPFDWKDLEAAGEDRGLPDEDKFTGANFTLGRLVVGNEDEGDPESEYGPVTLCLGNLTDNQGDWNGPEAVYADVLTIAPGGTFKLYRVSLYYRMNDPEEGNPYPRKLYMGDADLDGDVDFADYQALEANFGTTCGATWDMGDFDGDRDVDFADYGILEPNFGQGGRGDGGTEGLSETFDARPLPKLMDYDHDGDVDLDDLHILQEMMKEEDGQ